MFTKYPPFDPTGPVPSSSHIHVILTDILPSKLRSPTWPLLKTHFKITELTSFSFPTHSMSCIIDSHETECHASVTSISASYLGGATPRCWFRDCLNRWAAIAQLV